jgi:acyl dehydratase
MRSDFEQRNAIATLLRRADPDRATAQTRNEVLNQHGQVVIEYSALRMIRRRPPGAGR